MLREVVGLLGYQRLGPRIRETLRGHLRAAIRRGILERDGDFVRVLTVTMDEYTPEALRDTLTAVMLVVVNTVSALVHLYSLGYMSHDESQPRFFAYLSLFTFAMLMLVTADNLVQMF